MTIFCPHCGEVADDNSKYCPHCGELINEPNIVKEYRRNVSLKNNPNDMVKVKERLLYVLVIIFFLILILGSYILMKIKGY